MDNDTSDEAGDLVDDVDAMQARTEKGRSIAARLEAEEQPELDANVGDTSDVPPTEEPPAVEEALLSLGRVFDKFVPVKSIDIEDMHGVVHTCSTVVNGKAEIKVFRIMKTTLRPAGEKGVAAFGHIMKGELGQFGSALIDLAAMSDEVFEGIESAFLAAYPTAWTEAREAALKGGADPTALTTPGDLFGVGRMAGSLGPFFLNVIRQFLETAGALEVINDLNL